jgi:O-antigen/teichoic acid export membrane protein
MQSNRTFKLNTFFSLLNQIVTLICGFIVPQLILRQYGSSVNGLVNSINQFLSLIAFCELGVGAVIQSALYKPLANNDNEKVSRIVAASTKFFRIIGLILVAYSLFLIFVYPFFVKTDFDYWFSASLVAIISITYFAQYFFGINYQLLLYADNKVYVPSIISAITILANALVTFFLIKINCGIHVVKAISSLVFVLRPIAIYLYGKTHYKLNFKARPEKNEINQKWNGLAQHISNIVVEHTDTIVLTLFSSATVVSIYSVYYLVVSGLTLLVNALLTSLQPQLGKIYAQGKGVSEEFHKHELLMTMLISFSFVCCCLLLLPFVRIYTSGVTDANYIQPAFAIILSVAYLFFNLSSFYKTLIKAAGRYKETQAACFISAGINVVISIALVFAFGLVGIAIGTLLSGLFIYLYYIWYCYKRILGEGIVRGVKMLLYTALSFSCSYFALYFWATPKGDSITAWIASALIVSAISTIFCCAFAFIFFRKESQSFVKAHLLMNRKYGKMIQQMMSSNTSKNGERPIFESKPITLRLLVGVFWRWKLILLCFGVVFFSGSSAYFALTINDSYSSSIHFSTQGNVGSLSLNKILNLALSSNFSNEISTNLLAKSIQHENGDPISSKEVSADIAASYYQTGSKTYIKVSFNNYDQTIIVNVLDVAGETLMTDWNAQVTTSTEKLSIYKQPVTPQKVQDHRWIYTTAITAGGVIVVWAILTILDVALDKIDNLSDCEGIGCEYFSTPSLEAKKRKSQYEVNLPLKERLETSISRNNCLCFLETGQIHFDVQQFIREYFQKENAFGDIAVVDLREKNNRIASFACEEKTMSVSSSEILSSVAAGKVPNDLVFRPCLHPNNFENFKKTGTPTIFIFPPLSVSQFLLTSGKVYDLILLSAESESSRKEAYYTTKIAENHGLKVEYGILLKSDRPVPRWIEKKAKTGETSKTKQNESSNINPEQIDI